MKKMLVTAASLFFCAVLLHAQDPLKVAAEVYHKSCKIQTTTNGSWIEGDFAK